MSSENSASPGRYAHHYLAPQPDLSAETWLIAQIRPDFGGRALDMTGKLANHLQSHVREVVNGADINPRLAELPFAPAVFDLVVYQHQVTTTSDDDLFGVIREAARVLKPGGQLVVQDFGLPDDDRAAQYVDSFHRFHGAARRHSLPAYAWQGTMLDAGLTVARTAHLQRHIQLGAWAANCPAYVVERLHVLLHQAPTAVADYLRPFAVGTPDAMFTQTLVAVIGQKPVA